MIIAFIFFLLISQSIRRTDKAIIVVGIFMGLAASQCLNGYSCAGVPLFRRNGYRQSSGRKPLFRNRDTALN